VVARHSMHMVLLHRWLSAASLVLEGTINIVVIPPAQMVRSLAEGLIDGFCAGEPWNALAITEGCGFCVAVGSELMPQHVEKVLLVRKDLVLHRPEEFYGMIRGLNTASRYCDSIEGRNALVDLLQKPEWLGTAAGVLKASLLGPFDRGDGRVASSSQFNQFYDADGNVPSLSAARSVFNAMKVCGMIPNPEEASRELPMLFREDLHRKAFAPVAIASTSSGPGVGVGGIALTSH